MCRVFQPVARSGEYRAKEEIGYGGEEMAARCSIAADRKLMSVAVQATSGSLKFGAPRALFTIPFTLFNSGGVAPYTYDVMPDGQRFLAMVPEGDAASPPMTVILNWQAELSTAKK